MSLGFKPYYKWIVLNTGLWHLYYMPTGHSFKPYYKWIVLNTYKDYLDGKINFEF